MADLTKIPAINRAIQQYFDTNPTIKQVPAKDLMPYFIKAGIFEVDRKGGLPIREILRALDRSNQLHKIPFVYADRKSVNTNWYFIQKPGVFPQKENLPVVKNSGNRSASSKSNRDEHYVIDLMDKIIGTEAIRQHTFDFLRGDATDGRQGKKLPVDSYYPELKLVVEYREVQHIKPVRFFDKPDKMTVSGVHRGEQRRIYDERRMKLIPENGLALLEIPYSIFNCDSQDRIIRDAESDLIKLKQYIITHNPSLLKK
jgi:hypothetical protein